MQAASVFQRRWRKGFFTSRDRLGILGRMPGPCADVRIAKFLENAPEARLRGIGGEALPKNALQIHPAPAHGAVSPRIGTRLRALPQLRLLLVRPSEAEMQAPPEDIIPEAPNTYDGR